MSVQPAPLTIAEVIATLEAERDRAAARRRVRARALRAVRVLPGQRRERPELQLAQRLMERTR